MVVPFVWFIPKIRMGLLELDERSLNAPALVLVASEENLRIAGVGAR
jgi:hypothetical protein